MPSDLNRSLRDAAATPSREAPLSAIEARLRRRRNLRHGAIGVCAIALVGALSGGIALSSDDGPSIRTITPPAAQMAGFTSGLSIELPEGWVASPLPVSLGERAPVLRVGTTALDSSVSTICGGADFGTPPTAAFVEIFEYGAPVELSPRPTDFGSAPASGRPDCIVDATDVAYSFAYEFSDQGRAFRAELTFGSAADEDLRVTAITMLNSLVVSPITVPPEPVTTTAPPLNVPESSDTAAITAAFETWIGSKPQAFDGVDGVVEDWANIKPTAKIAVDLVGDPQCYTGHVDAITRVGETDADVIFSFLCDGRPATPNHAQGRAVKINGVWMVSRDTVCETYAIGQARCPARK